MTPGPRPYPAKLRMLHGENRPSQVNLNEPTPRDALPICPDEASENVRSIWDHTVRELDAMHLAHAADRDALFCYCDAVATHRRATEIINQSGLLIRGQKGNMVRNPMVQVQRDAAQTVRNFAQEFGLTPSSRARIESKTDDDSDAENPFAGTG